MVWVAVRAEGESYGVCKPRRSRILCVGTDVAVLEWYPDTKFEFCYPTRAACFERCRDLYNIYTARPREEYPHGKQAA